MTHYYWKGELRSGPVELAAEAPSFRYGLGIFETLLYNGRKVLHFDLHMQRLEDSLRTLGFRPKRLDPKRVLDVVRANGLEGRTARVNILAPVENPDQGVPLAVFAAPHTPPGDGAAVRLCRVPQAVRLPLGGHKSMNYMFHYLERRRAQAAGYDDAVIVDPDGSVVESCASALLFRFGQEYVAPTSNHALPSISLSLARRVLQIQERPLPLGEALGADAVWVLNSLNGMRPVERLEDVAFAPDHGTAAVVAGIITGAGGRG